MKIMRVRQQDGSLVNIPIGRGADGKTAYAYARDGGYTGTETEFAAKLAKEVPTKTSELTNDSGFLTAHQDISGKVDKVSGKGLSTNDFTNADKTKLNSSTSIQLISWEDSDF